MVGTEFIDYISKFQLTTYAGVEDFADKFNLIFTVIIISICTIVVTVKQYILKPISCYIATSVGGTNLLNYVENYCWVQGTLPISYSRKMPSTDSAWQEMESKKILYYQWVPFVLGLQCILFYLPRLIWQLLCHHITGSDLEHIIKKAVDAVHAKENDRADVIDELATWVEHLIFQSDICNDVSSPSLSSHHCCSPFRVLQPWRWASWSLIVLTVVLLFSPVRRLTPQSTRLHLRPFGDDHVTSAAPHLVDPVFRDDLLRSHLLDG